MSLVGGRDARLSVSAAMLALAVAGCGGPLTLEQVRTTLQGTRDLAKRDLRGLNLAGLDLRGVNLRDADLARANLGGADLTGAVLLKADLEKANLSRARVRDADLSDANLEEARLEDADLTGARLLRANLRRAVLRGAILDDARLDEARLRGADLEGARIGMTSTRHVLRSPRAAWLAGLAAGTTTRQDIVRALGAPAVQYEGDRILVYRLLTNRTGGFLVAPRTLDPGDGWLRDWVEADHALVLVFDGDRLARHELVHGR